MSKAHGKEYVENNFSPNNGQLQQQQPQVQQQHYFDAKKNTQVLPCQFCEETFVRKNDLVIHLENVHHLPMHLVTGSQVRTESPVGNLNVRSMVKEGHHKDFGRHWHCMQT